MDDSKSPGAYLGQNGAIHEKTEQCCFDSNVVPVRCYRLDGFSTNPCRWPSSTTATAVRDTNAAGALVFPRGMAANGSLRCKYQFSSAASRHIPGGDQSESGDEGIRPRI